MKKVRQKYRFQWHSGNEFKLLVDGDSFFPEMCEAINKASHYVLLEMYLFESGKIANQFIKALMGAVARGVRVYILLDDIGSRGLTKRDRARMISGGISLLFYNPLRYSNLRSNLFRDHRKLLLVDGFVAFIGGAGIKDSFGLTTRNGPEWHEMMVQVKGSVVQDWQTLFTEGWNHCSPKPLELPIHPLKVINGSQLGRVTLSQAVSHLEIKRSILKRIRSAERKIWIVTPYFVPSWKIRRALRSAAKNGTDVRLLLPGPISDHPAVRHAGRRFYGKLLRGGVQIFEDQTRFVHAKVILCDHWVSIGSSNMDRWSLRWNLEANQEIDDQNFAMEVQNLLQQDFARSQEISYQQWHNRPWYRRLLEWFWGHVDIWLERRG